MSSAYSQVSPVLQRPPITSRQQSQLDVFSGRMNALHALQPSEASALEALIVATYSVSPHQDILHEHQPTKEALVLLKGMACRYQVVNQSRRQMTGFVLPGGFCDLAFLSASVTRQGVMSLGRGLVGRIDLRSLAAVASQMPNVMVAAVRAATLEHACATELVISLGVRDALQRMAHFLCELHHRLNTVGLVGANGEFELAMSQAELGEALGLSTVHVNRTVQHLRKRKLIVMAKGKVHLLDRAGLEAVAGFDQAYLRSN